jgi:hypothetical protein
VITVKVTQEDIDDGKQASCYDCPLAIALSRAIGCDVGVSGGKASWVDRYGVNEVWLPPVADDWYRRFDNDNYGRGPVSPFEFELDVPTGDAR